MNHTEVLDCAREIHRCRTALRRREFSQAEWVDAHTVIFQRYYDRVTALGFQGVDWIIFGFSVFAALGAVERNEVS